MPDEPNKRTQNEKIDQSANNNLPALDLPKDWDYVSSEGIGPFVTKATFKHPKGYFITWKSRYNRKHNPLLEKSHGSTWWAPGAVGWWIGVLFAMGATSFALGSAPNYATWVGNRLNGLTFFAGSLFFTTAAFLQYFEAINAIRSPKGVKIMEELKLMTWEPKRIDWWSTVVQFAGTLLFNVNTLEAMRTNLLTTQVNHLVWVPDMIGSGCFLIASSLAWFEVVHSFWSWKPRSIPWWVVALNLIGSASFGISAISAYTLPATGQFINVALVNIGTFVGAGCFFVGAILLFPERTQDDELKNS
jgi:hypothetical protein